MAWGLGLAAASLVGGLLQSDASTSAAQTQAGAANNATASQMQMFNTINAQGAPYRTAGTQGLNKLSDLLGISPRTSGNSVMTDTQTPLTKDQFDAQAYINAYPDIAGSAALSADPYQHYLTEGRTTGSYRPAFQLPADGSGADPSHGSLLKPFTSADTYLAPNYQFRLDQGLGATANFLNKTGGLISGNTLRGINDYAQGTAGDAYQQAFDIYNTNQNNIYNRLSNIAGLGQVANQTTANAGTAISGGVANSTMNAGASQAAGRIGSANALAGGLNNAGSWYTLSQIMPRSGSTIDPSAFAG